MFNSLAPSGWTELPGAGTSCSPRKGWVLCGARSLSLRAEGVGAGTPWGRSGSGEKRASEVETKLRKDAQRGRKDGSAVRSSDLGYASSLCKLEGSDSTHKVN